VKITHYQPIPSLKRNGKSIRTEGAKINHPRCDVRGSSQRSIIKHVQEGMNLRYRIVADPWDFMDRKYLLNLEMISLDKIHSPLTVQRARKWDSDLSISHTSSPESFWFSARSSILFLPSMLPFRAPYKKMSYLSPTSNPSDSPQLHLQNQTSSRLSPLLLFHVSPHRNSPLIGSYWTSLHIWICNFSVVIDRIYMFL
jgi:hypothetical protein